MRGDAATAPYIGFAIVLDILDGRIARMTGTTSAFVEFDSLADVISFGIAPAILSFAWGLPPLGRLGWAAGFMFVSAAAMRLARFNIRAPRGDKRYFVGMPSPAAAAIRPRRCSPFQPGSTTIVPLRCSRWCSCRRC
jgi:CDP-diacylglycerol--serine O-phosphatidyltransferase